jgi:hypothetical protein
MPHNTLRSQTAISIALSGMLACAPATGARQAKHLDSALSLDALLACADRAAGGDSLRARADVTYVLDIVEPAFHAVGRYRATRSGTARIDIFVDSVRVFSEGWEWGAGWDQRGGDAPRRTVIPPASGSALRHGIEQPGHLWTLADMTRNGHAIVIAGRDTIGGLPYAVLRVTLADGFNVWYWVNPTTCLIERNRNFRAFHPDLDSTRAWTETRFSDYRATRGVVKPWLSTTVEVPSGKVLGTTRVVSLTYDDSTAAGVIQRSK